MQYIVCSNIGKDLPRITKNASHAAIVWVAIFHVIPASSGSTKLFLVI